MTTFLRIEILSHWFRSVIYLFAVLLLGSQHRILHWLGKGQRLYSEIRKVRCMKHVQLQLVLVTLFIARLPYSSASLLLTLFVMFSREAD